jgi:hypothetical protein
MTARSHPPIWARLACDGPTGRRAGHARFAVTKIIFAYGLVKRLPSGCDGRSRQASRDDQLVPLPPVTAGPAAAGTTSLLTAAPTSAFASGCDRHDQPRRSTSQNSEDPTSWRAPSVHLGEQANARQVVGIVGQRGGHQGADVTDDHAGRPNPSSSSSSDRAATPGALP